MSYKDDLPGDPYKRLQAHVANYYCEAYADEVEIQMLHGALARGEGDEEALAELVDDLIELDLDEEDTLVAHNARVRWRNDVRNALEALGD